MRYTKARRHTAQIVTGILMLLGTTLVQSATAARPVPFGMVREIEQLAAQVVSRGKVTGLAIGIVHEDEVLLERGFGVTEAGRKEAVDADTVFRIASLSKAFAGTVTALLVRDGLMSWQSRVVDHLPEFKLKELAASEKLTVRDILSHRVGLPFHAYDRELESAQPYPLLREKLDQAPVTCEPGNCYAYQNVAFSLIGDMVFAATGNFFYYEVERRIFHPLGMYTATYGREALEASGRWARPHVRARRGGWVAVRPNENYYRVPPAAGVNASIRDLNQWLIAQMGGRPDVLPPELLEEVQSPLVRTPGERRSGGWRGERVRDAEYALGWRVFDYAGRKLVFHAGAVQGYRGMIAFLPDQRFGLVVLWNCESNVPAGLLPSTFDRFLGLSDRDWTGLTRRRR